MEAYRKLRQYRSRPQNFWQWWRHDTKQDEDVRLMYKKLTRHVLPDLPNGNRHPIDRDKEF